MAKTCKCGYEGRDSHKYPKGMTHADYSLQFRGEICTEVSEEENGEKKEKAVFKLAASPYSEEDAGGAGAGYHGVPAEEGQENKSEVAEEVLMYQIESLDPPPVLTPDLTKEDVLVLYDELIGVMTEDAKDISLGVAGQREGNAFKKLKEAEQKWVNAFLLLRPDQLSEAGLVASPQAIGELVIIFQEAHDRLMDDKYEGARTILENFLKVYRQLKEFTKAPSQVSK